MLKETSSSNTSTQPMEVNFNADIDGRNISLAEDKFDYTKDEVSLWRAVITQALMDAGSNSSKKEMLYAQSQAVSWLSANSEDFNTVCLMADMDPVEVRKKSQAAIKRGCVWRKERRIKNNKKQIIVKNIDGGLREEPEEVCKIVQFAR